MHTLLDLLVPEAGATYAMDRGYVEFSRLNRLHQAGAFFVTRAKSNMRSRRVRYKDAETGQDLAFLDEAIQSPSRLSRDSS